MADKVQTHVGVHGIYNFRMQVNGVDVVVEPDTIRQMSITQDIDRLVPSLRMEIPSGGGFLTDVVPFDQRTKLSIEFGRGRTLHENYNSFDFDVFRSFNHPDDSTWEAEGLMAVDGLISPVRTRGFNDSVKDVLIQIAEELCVDRYKISSSLDYTTVILQTQLSNANLIAKLRKDLVGKNGDAAYQIFIVRDTGRTIFTCRSLNELIREQEGGKKHVQFS